ncbi:hypothetical protein O181_026800 [Austropuccinia psidii MF-1]|uniref:Helicase C-terminal domain-containing protein n=1 Tax=Austropuccinia psidii MF-1 TaxID=1389203 RepID=A0A9Q3CQ39_9BASI|nr:hypothetical protein [Austropuccinia psidii MF-1]
MIQIPLLPHQKTGLPFHWDQEIPNGQSAHNLCATLPPGSTFHARKIITTKMVSSFESLSANTPLGRLLSNDMGLSKIIQAIALIGTYHEGGSTPNSSTITQNIVDVETCMMSSKIAHLLKSLLKNKKSNCGPSQSVVFTQWTQFVDLICIALSHHSILSALIHGKIPAQAQEKALENFSNNPECEVLIASIATAVTSLNITCTNIFYLMVRGTPKFYPSSLTLTSSFPGAQLEPSH